MRLRAGVVAVAMVLAVAVTACSSPQQPPASDVAAAPDIAPAASEAPCAPVDAFAPTDTVAGGRELVVWHIFSGSYFDELDRLVGQWEQSDRGVPVRLEAFGSTDAVLERFRAVPESGRPDLLLGNEVQLATMADSGQFIPAGRCAEATGSDLRGALVPVMAQTWSRGDTWWAVPFAVSTPLLFGNLEVARNAGVAGMPATLDELDDAVAAVVDNGERTGLGYDTGFFAVLIEQWTARMGQPLVATADGVPTARFDTPAATEAMGWITALDRAGDASLLTGEQANVVIEVFAPVAPLPFAVGSSAAMGYIRGFIELGVLNIANVGVGGLPLPGSGALVGGSAWWLVNRPGADPAVAYDLAAWLASPAVQAPFSVRTGYIPVTPGTIDQPEVVEAWQRFPLLRVAWDQVAPGVDGAVVAALQVGPRQQLRELLNDAGLDALDGVPVPDALAAANQGADALLGAYARSVPGGR